MMNATSFLNIVGVRYGIDKQIGEGSFGTIFEGTNLLNHQQVAVKFEPYKSTAPQLSNEYRAYKALFGCPGIPNVYHFGREGFHNILVMDLLGPSLEDLFEQCNRKFTVKTVVMVAKQMLSRIQTVHGRGLIHRDIKPENFLAGRQGSMGANTIHIVDFGMAKQYRDPKTKQHIIYRERKSLTGTARYMSVNAHLRREQSRRDDLEALGYVIMYFLRGDLPWQGLKATTNEQKYNKIGRMKQTIPVENVCSGFPREFNTYLMYVRNLGFEDTPDYDYLHGLLTQALESTGDIEDGVYDWMKSNSLTGSKSMRVNSVVPQVRHLDIRQNYPSAVVIHNQRNTAHPPAKHHQLMESPLNYRVARPVLRNSWDRAQFRYSESSLIQNQCRATHLHSQNTQPLHKQLEPEVEGDFMHKITNTLCCSRDCR